MKINLVQSTDGDWEGIYVDGILKEEGHSLSPWHILKALGLDFSHHDVDFESCGISSLPMNLEQIYGP